MKKLKIFFKTHLNEKNEIILLALKEFIRKNYTNKNKVKMFDDLIRTNEEYYIDKNIDISKIEKEVNL